MQAYFFTCQKLTLILRKVFKINSFMLNFRRSFRRLKWAFWTSPSRCLKRKEARWLVPHKLWSFIADSAVHGAINYTLQDKWCSDSQGGCLKRIWLLYQPHILCKNPLQLFFNVKIPHMLYCAHVSSFLWLTVFVDSSPEVQNLLMYLCAHCVVSVHSIICNMCDQFIVLCTVLS